MYHEIFSLSLKADPRPETLHTGYYEFFHDGGFIRGNLVRIGETVTIKTPFNGIIEMNTLKFIDSNPVKL